MNIVVIHAKNSFLLLKLAFNIIYQEKRLILGTLLYLFCNLVVFIIYSLVIYLLYEIHIFDIDSIYIVQEFSIFEQFIHILAMFILVILCSWVTLISKCGTVFSTIRFLDGNRIRLVEGILKSAEKIKDISILSMIYTLDVTWDILGIFEIIKHQIFEWKKELEGEPVKRKESNMLDFLDIPLISFENLTVPESIKKSKELVVSKFGINAHLDFSLNVVYVLTLLSVFFTLNQLFTYLFNQLAAFVLCIAITLVICAIFDTSVSILKAAIYNYCNNKPTNLFEGYINKLISK